jgi:hypothetical protein
MLRYEKILYLSHACAILKNGNVIYKLYPTSRRIDKEYNNALLIRDLPFNKSRLLSKQKFKTNEAICYEYIEGDERDADIELSIDNLIFKEVNGEEIEHNIFEKYCLYASSLHKDILKNKVRNADCYKKDLRRRIICNNEFPKDEVAEAIKVLDRLPTGDTLLHGDFSISNIIVKKNEPYAIDFGSTCRGPELYDIAKFIYKACFSNPLNEVNNFIKFSRKFEKGLIEPLWDQILITKKKQRKILANIYLKQMNTSWEEIEDYLFVLNYTHAGIKKTQSIKEFKKHLHKYYPVIDESYFNNLDEINGTSRWSADYKL